MAKRRREVDDGDLLVQLRTRAKRTRVIGTDFFESLSDELVLRTLSYLSVTQLTTVERLCKRFRRLASDNEIWRENFYNRFVRPRARRIPGLRGLDDSNRGRQALYYASKQARWLEHSILPGANVDWKRRYKVKLNWSRGRCKAQEMTLDGPIKPRILVKLYRGTIFTASQTGVKSYSQRSRPQLLNTYYWEPSRQQPTTMTVGARGSETVITIGFVNGSFQVLCVDADTGLMYHDFTSSASPKASITNIATAWPYVLAISNNKVINLYEMKQEQFLSTWHAVLLANLNSEAVLSPVSMTIRQTKSILIASIAYSFRRLNSGWCLGVQEIRLSHTGEIIGSRLASAVDAPATDHPLLFPADRQPSIASRSASTEPLPLHPQLSHPPNTLSHSGCYVLAGLSDNTLMVYTITSTEDVLSISGGRRLWGHTSSVTGAEISDRGKALSISGKGSEVRIWEFEDLLSKFNPGRGNTSTEIRPLHHHIHGAVSVECSMQKALARRGTGLGLAWQEVRAETQLSLKSDDALVERRHWVGFDDEQVIVLGEKGDNQVLCCYDFA